MQAKITLSGLTSSVPKHVADRRAAAARAGAGTAVVTMPGASRQLFDVPPRMKPRTVLVLVKHALDRLAPFEIPNLDRWDVEVCEHDDGYQVDFTNKRGARLAVDNIQLTANKCGTHCDFGISASVD